MFSFTESLVSFNFKFKKTVGGVGQIGGEGQVSPDMINELKVPWQDLLPGAQLFSLLSWHTKISKFAGRETEFQELEKWAESQPSIWIKFMVGQGGVGKSRTAAEFADFMKNKNWSAGFVDLRKPQVFPMNKEGTLMIIDYPEENVSGVEQLFKDLAGLGQISRFRVLFLTRQTADNWYQIIGNCHGNNITDMTPINLGRLEGPAAYKIYDSTLLKAAKELDTKPLPLSEEALTKWLELAPENDRALFIAAAALHSAVYPKDEVIRYTGRDVIKTLVDRELQRFTGLANKRKQNDDYVYAKLPAMAAIADELTISDIANLANNNQLALSHNNESEIEKDLKTTGLLSDGKIKAPKPDIVAAAFTVEVLSKSKNAPELIWCTLEKDIEGGLERIGRLCYDAEIVLGIQKPCLSDWLAEAARDNHSRCSALVNFILEAVLPLGLIKTAVTVYQTLLKSEDDEEEKVQFLNNLSVHLNALGDNSGALDVISKAVEIYRRLAKVNPARFESGLALSLNNLSNGLSNTGDKTGALETIGEAVEIRRRLANVDPNRFETDLAQSLNNLSVQLRNAGDNTGALKAIRDAVAIRRRLAIVDPIRAEPVLAGNLSNLSNRLSDTGDNMGALEAINEAVEIRRRLAKANPARFEPDLAQSLNNLSNRLSDTGNNTGALEVIRKAVEIYRRLVKANPIRFEPDLAFSLIGLSSRLGDSGDYTSALEVCKESVEIFQRLAKTNPARFEPKLGWSFAFLGDALRNLEQIKEAIVAFNEAIDLLRPYVQKWPKGKYKDILEWVESELESIE